MAYNAALEPSNTNALPVCVVGSSSETLVNVSGTIAAINVAQTLSPARSAPRRILIENNSAYDFWIAPGITATAANPSIKIPARSMYESPWSTTLEISIICTATASYTAWDY